MADKLVGVLGLDVVFAEDFGGEILQVISDDDIAAATQGGGEDMAVIGIWQREGWDEFFVAYNQGIGNSGIHQGTGVLELGGGEVGAVEQDVTRPLVMNGGAPAGTKQAGKRQLEQQVAQGSGIEHAGVVESGVSGHTRGRE